MLRARFAVCSWYNLTKLGCYPWPWACCSVAVVIPTEKAHGTHIPALQARPTQHSLWIPQISYLPLNPGGLAEGWQRSEGDHNTAYFCLPHVLCCPRKGPIPKGKEAAEFHLWVRKWAFSQTKAQPCAVYAAIEPTTTAAHQRGRGRCSEHSYTSGKNKSDPTSYYTPK